LSRGTWNTIRSSKRFYVDTFRWAGRALLISISLSIVLSIAVLYVYYSRPEHDFYSTNGETPPVPLTSMDEPNGSEYPLLANDQSVDNATKEIPR
jgi:intracellular multiplication protein IcmM